MQEIIDKMCFQKYFSIVYLGQVIQCSLEFPQDINIEINKIDMSSADVNNKTISLSININTNYPSIDKDTESPNSALISKFQYNTDFYYDAKYPPTFDKNSTMIE